MFSLLNLCFNPYIFVIIQPFKILIKFCDTDSACLIIQAAIHHFLSRTKTNFHQITCGINIPLTTLNQNEYVVIPSGKANTE